jgi:hypothetical protein
MNSNKNDENNLLNSLKNLKDRLNNLEVNFGEKQELIEKREKSYENLEKKIESIIKIQNERIKVEAGGRVYETTKNTIKDCIFDNVLKSQIIKEEEGVLNIGFYKSVYNYGEVVNNDNDNDNSSDDAKSHSYFVDLDKKSFKLILKILRFFSTNSLGEKFKVFLTHKVDEEFLKKEILYFFNNNQEIFNSIEFIKIRK